MDSLLGFSRGKEPIEGMCIVKGNLLDWLTLEGLGDPTITIWL